MAFPPHIGKRLDIGVYGREEKTKVGDVTPGYLGSDPSRASTHIRRAVVEG